MTAAAFLLVLMTFGFGCLLTNAIYRRVEPVTVLLSGISYLFTVAFAAFIDRMLGF
ncbi:hypothetical protein AEGHOMDF_3859 [Methylobacterium soli]|nr:hypothetical protein AEGHOMDF_3859 [Methylobacterium soli]